MNGTGYIPVGSSQKTQTLWYIFDLIELVYQAVYILIYIYICPNMHHRKNNYLHNRVFNKMSALLRAKDGKTILQQKVEQLFESGTLDRLYFSRRDY